MPANHQHGPMSSPLDAITWPVRTDRLMLRPATREDLEATWQFRRLDGVGRWLTRAPATLEQHRAQFEDGARLTKTLVVVLDGEVIGELMLQVDDAWSQAEVAEGARDVQAELGWVLRGSGSTAWGTRCSPRSGEEAALVRPRARPRRRPRGGCPPCAPSPGDCRGTRPPRRRPLPPAPGGRQRRAALADGPTTTRRRG